MRRVALPLKISNHLTRRVIVYLIQLLLLVNCLRREETPYLCLQEWLPTHQQGVLHPTIAFTNIRPYLHDLLVRAHGQSHRHADIQLRIQQY